MWTSKKNKEYVVEFGEEIDPFVEKFKSLIQECREAVTEEHSKFLKDVESDEVFNELDDCLLLRYIIQEKGDKNKVIESIQKALKWRTENHKILKTLRTNENGFTFDYGEKASTKEKTCREIKKYLVSGLYLNVGDIGAAIRVSRVAMIHQKSLIKKFTSEQLLFNAIMNNEAIFRSIHESTKTTRRFVQKFQFVDFTGFSISSSERKYIQIMAGYKKIGSFLHPKLIYANVDFFMSPTLSMLANAAKSLVGGDLPVHRVKSKKQPLEELRKKCPAFAKINGVEEVLPEFIGGNVKTPAYFSKSEESA